METIVDRQERVIDKFGLLVCILKYYGYIHQAAYLWSWLSRNVRELFSKHEQMLFEMFTKQEIYIFDAETENINKYLSECIRYFDFRIGVRNGESVQNLITFFNNYTRLRREQSLINIKIKSLLLKLDTICKVYLYLLKKAN